VHSPTTADFSTAGASPTQVNVTVVPPPNSTSGSTGCLIQRSPDGTAWTTVKPFSNVYTFADSGLTSGAKYWYRIQFRNAGGVAISFSPAKTEFSVPSPVVTTTSHKVRSRTPLIQGTVGTGATAVTVYVGGTGYAATLSGTTWSLTTPTQAEGSFSIYAQATMGTSLSSLSHAITLTIDVTPPAPPTNVRTKAYHNTIDLEWDPSTSSDVVGYLVYRKVGTTGSWALLTTTGVVPGTKYRDSSVSDGT